MIAGRNFESHEPLTWWGRVPIYASTLLVAFYALAMIATALVMAAQPSWLDLTVFAFSTSAILEHFALWRVFTYPFINPPDIWFLVEMFFLFTFGREVEKYLGTQAFLWFYGFLILTAPVVLLLGSAVMGPIVYSGSNAVNFAVFIAFATIYPRAEFIFGLTAKWMALALLAINALQGLAQRNWAMLLASLFTALVAYLLISQNRFDFEAITHWWHRLRLRMRGATPKVMARPAPGTAPTTKISRPATDAYETIDPILDKIASKGMASLTREERAQLEKARAELLAKERKN